MEEESGVPRREDCRLTWKVVGRFRTDEREQLCEYIDLTLSENGVDVAALAVRQGIDRAGITDRWRDW
ncbi:hypothetical protein [Streptomyces sp. bgisy095]|uniref:hypothetical protein n=1 Tax=unclassified Streptomyces TaxID=2593676 RepID=UPI003D7259C6